MPRSQFQPRRSLPTPSRLAGRYGWNRWWPCAPSERPESSSCAWRPTRPLLFQAVGKLFNYRVRKHFACHAFDLGFCLFGGEAIGQRKREILALTDRVNIGVADFAEGVLDGLALRAPA